MALEREYKIEVSGRRCRTCDRAFAVGDEYYSAVVETAQEDLLERHDFCPACWKADGAYFSFWKTRVPEPQQAPQHGPRLIDLGRLLQLFEHLADAADVQAQRFRYVLALVLMRKRRLKIVESRRRAGGGQELTLRETGAERRHTVTAPSVTEEEIRSVADRLREVLDMPERWDQVSEPGAEAPADARPDETGRGTPAAPASEPTASEPAEPPSDPAAEAAGDADSAADDDSGAAGGEKGGDPDA